MNLDTLYELDDGSGGAPIIQAVSGTINVYVSYALPASSPVTDDMNLIASDGSEIYMFNDLPKYVYITQKTGTSTIVDKAMTATAV